MDTTRRERATIRDVARKAGVSISTVSRLINETDSLQMRASTRQKILDAIAELEYTPVKAAQDLRRQRTHVLALLLPDISNPFFSLLARGVEAAGFEEGYATLICDSNNSLEQEAEYFEVLLRENVDGLVLVSVGRRDPKDLDRLARYSVQVVGADRRIDGAACVEAENAAGSRRLAGYLLGLGYSRPAYVGGPQDVSTAEDRLSGFLSGLSQAGVSPVCVHRGDFTYEAGLTLGARVLEERSADVIVAGNDLMAIGVLHAAEARGLRVPEDIGIAGFDGTPWASLLRPRLTTVRVPFFEIGRQAVRVLVNLLVSSDVGADCEKLPVELIAGDSTRPQS